ncbi:MAG: Hsp33 family molecular chaperone HslO [Bacilli bacterium]|nr:Hsp33 family molecular chaperone HslO [Bacilli bacterium]
MDKLLKALALDDQVRIYIVNNTETVNEAIRRHDLWPSSASVLGKILTMGVLMGSMLKGEEALTIKLLGNGQIGRVIVDAQANGNVRGYCDNPHINFVNNDGGLNDIYTLGNDGMIDVIKDLKMKDLFTSSIRLTGNIASDFTYYFHESEQTLSLVSLGILINPENKCEVSGGIIVQLLPNATEEAISFLESKMDLFNNFSKSLLSKDLPEILDEIFDNKFDLLEEKETSFKCTCSKESYSRSLLTLGSKTLQELLDEDKGIDAECHYCGEHYKFNEDEIKALIEEAKKQNK